MSTQQTGVTRFLEADGINFGIPPSSTPLALTRDVILYDYAGVGHSSGPVATFIIDMSANLISFLTALMLLLKTTKFDVLGFSIGGYVAQQLVQDSPGLVNKLTLSGTAPSLGPELLNPAAEISSRSPLPRNPRHRSSSPSSTRPHTTSQAAAAAWVERIFADSRTMPAGETSANFLPGADKLANTSSAYLNWSGDTSPYTLPPTIDKDVLVTAGHSDALVPMANSFTLSQKLTNAFFLTFLDSGQGRLFQFADLYTKKVIEFLDGVWKTGATGA